MITAKHINSMPASEVLYREVVMVSSFFSFVVGERVIWLAPATKSLYAIFNGFEIKADGNQYAVITTLPGMANEPVMNFTVLADQIIPAWE